MARAGMLITAVVAALTVTLVVAHITSLAQAQPEPVATAAATCDEHPNQASAQRAKDTRDSDGDGIYCETLPCPCLPPDPRADGVSPEPLPSPAQSLTPARSEDDRSCAKPSSVQRLLFSASRYPNIRRHFRGALRRGWPSILVVNRAGADARRARLLEQIPTRAGFDRDEYPPAVGRGRGRGLTRGTNPRGWRADVRYVPSSENRSHGSVLGAKLSALCNGTRFRYAFK